MWGLGCRLPGAWLLLSRNVERLRGGLVFKAHRLLYHSTLGSSVIKKMKEEELEKPGGRAGGFPLMAVTVGSTAKTKSFYRAKTRFGGSGGVWRGFADKTPAKKRKRLS